VLECVLKDVVLRVEEEVFLKGESPFGTFENGIGMDGHLNCLVYLVK
jgi:hypothetical protein